MKQATRKKLFDILLEKSDCFEKCQYCKRWNNGFENPYCSRYCRVQSKWKPNENVVEDINDTIDEIYKVIKEE